MRDWPLPIYNSHLQEWSSTATRAKRALIVKLGAIGDVVMAIPAVYALHCNGFQVDWVAASQAASVLQLYPFVRVLQADEQAILHGSAAQRLRGLGKLWTQLHPQYDLAATLYYDQRYRALSLFTFAQKRVRLRADDRRWHLLPGRHHTDEFARILLSGAGIKMLAQEGQPAREDGAVSSDDAGPVPTSLRPMRPAMLPPSPLAASKRPRIVLAPGGARNLLRDDRLRRWPLKHYGALASMLVQAGHEVVVTGGLGDTWVREAFTAVPHIDLIGQLSLPELLAVLDSSHVVVTHDSGPLHLAGITRCNLLGIFGPVDPGSRLPRRPGCIALWGGEGYSCRPCYDGSRYAKCQNNTCMDDVTPQQALAAVERLLQQSSTSQKEV